jgi:hypothetical protein
LDVGLIAPALTNPKNLERLEFEWHFDGREGVAPALAQARAFIAACPNLKILDIKRECTQCTSYLPFSDLLRDAPVALSPSEFAPSVEVLTVRHSLPLTASCPLTMRYLSNLTTLAISNAQPAHQLLWPEFLRNRIRILSLTMHVATEALVEYLVGYQGLKSFCARQIEGWSEDSPSEAVPNNEACSKRVVLVGLAHHRASLERISFTVCQPIDMYATDPVGLEAWGADEDYLGCLPQFSKLTTLGLVMIVDEEMNCRLLVNDT